MKGFVRFQDLPIECLNKLLGMTSINASLLGRTSFNVKRKGLTDFQYIVRIQDGTVFKLIFENIPNVDFYHFYHASKNKESFIEVKKFILKQKIFMKNVS